MNCTFSANFSADFVLGGYTGADVMSIILVQYKFKDGSQYSKN